MKQSDNAKPNDGKLLCVSVFKSGESTVTKEQFTKAWVDLINKIEKSKESIARRR